MQLPDAIQRHLQLALADAASGTPRQWWHLEIAAQLPASQPGPLLRWYCGRLGRQRRGLWLPLLAQAGLRGLQPYRLDYAAPGLQRAAEAALVSLCLLGSLLGLASLNATRELLLILLALFGAVASGGLAWQAAAALRRAQLAQHAATAEHLTPSEAALGLTGLFSASGMDYPAAQQAAQRLARLPQTATPAELAQLGLPAPAAVYVHLAAARAALGWLGGVAIVAWPCWLTASPWQWLPAALGLLLLHYVGHGQRPGWWRLPLRHIAIGLAILALASLSHWR